MFELDRLAERARDKARDMQRDRDTFDRIDRTLDDTWDSIRDRVTDILEPVYELFERVIEFSLWVLERVRVVYPVSFYRFVVHGDERTCPECAAWQGATWEQDAALVGPPLHVNCRCRVIHAWTEWRVRFVDEWRLRWMTRSEWEWRLTGWA